MAYVSFPALVPASTEFGLKSNVQVSASDLSGYVQTSELPGARWTTSLRMPTLARDPDGAVFEAWIASLRGGAVRARIPVFQRGTPLGSWAGSPAVNNEVGSPTLSQTGNTLYVRAFTAAATVKKGDFFNLGSGGQLLMVTADATADGSGLAQLSVEPAIRTAPAHNTALVFTDPVVPYMILTDSHPRWRLQPAELGEYALDFVEVFE